MTELAELLEQQLSEHVVRLRQVDARARVQLVVCGPSSSALRSLFARLTRDGKQDWLPITGGNQLSVPVLLVSVAPEVPRPDSRSCACTWDYAVNARNSYEVSLLLVEPQMWDRPESIRTATDTLATPMAFEGRARSPNWLLAGASSRLASTLNTPQDLLVDALRYVWRDAQGLETDKRSGAPWDALSYLLSLLPLDEQPLVKVYRACGLPSPSEAQSRPQTAYETLALLAEYLEEQGLEAGFEELKATATGSQITEHLDGLHAHLQQSAGSGGGFNRLRTLAFRPSLCGAPPGWWLTLSEVILTQLLDEVGARKPEVKVKVQCTNALNQGTATKGEPVIVAGAVELEISCDGAPGFQALSVSRRVGRRAPQLVVPAAPSQSPTVFVDSDPPPHDRQLRYQAQDIGARSSRIDVISLAKFSAPGLISSPDASRITVPDKDGSTWSQEIEFESTGVQRLRIYSSPATRTIRYAGGGEGAEFSPADCTSAFNLPVDEETEASFSFLDAAGTEIGKFKLLIVVRENITEAPRTYFESLVLAHQRGRIRPSPVVLRDQIIRSLESAILSSSDSWKPLLLGGEQPDARISNLDWSKGVLGRFALQFDPRFPQPALPEPVGSAREEVRRALVNGPGALVEQPLTEDEFVVCVENYARAYLDWLRAEPAAALWCDCVAVLEAEPNPAAGGCTAAGEPVAILLSPLHPSKLAWMCNAQRLLRSSLRKSCPLAGLLDPNRSPDITAWPIFRGVGEPLWTTLISVPCEDAYWSLLWNSRMLDRLRSSATAMLLRAIGVGPRGFEGGFTAAQSVRTLDDVSRMMPARSVLRVGVVGENEGQSTCAQGIISWSQETFAPENARSWPAELHVFDARRPEDQPKNEELSNLAEDTDGRVLWYDRQKKELPTNLDAIILDQLGVREPVLSTSSYRSPVSPGSLLRTRLRIDRDSARWIRETRIQSGERVDEGLMGVAFTCVAEIEQLALSKANASLLEFAPNHVAVGKRLDQAGLVAVSSAEIDPACFARNAAAYESYLWDYELPFADGVSDQRVGYYKLSKPSNAVRRTVEAATKLLSANPPPVDDLLAEISRRGIPILKKLASGGTQARGEIGVLLSVRLLQDIFGARHYSCRLPVATANSVAILVPVDPFTSLFRKVQQSLLGSESELIRPDVLAICAHFDQGDQVQIYITPIEVKFRESLASDSALFDWLRQAGGFGEFLRRLWASTPPTDLWSVCGKGLLAHIVNYGMRVYGDQRVTGLNADDWAKRHESILTAIYSGTAEIVINEEGRLAAFDTSPTSRLLDLDNDGLPETLVVCRSDSKAILERTLPAGTQIDHAVERWQLCGIAVEGHLPDAKDVGTAAPPSGLGAAATAQGVAASTELITPPSTGIPGEPPLVAEHSEGGEPRVVLAGPEAARSMIPPEVRERVARAFDGFVGNSQAVDSLKRDLLRALIEKPPHLPKNYLFVGNPSTGKTELARRVAAALRLPFVRVDGRTVTSREKLFELIDAELQRGNSLPTKEGTQYGKPQLSYPPLIVFVDEVHLVARAVQESFLTLLESQDRTVVLDDRVAILRRATHLFATTRGSELDAAFRSRCTEVYLHPYTESEVAEMLARVFKQWPRELLKKLARYGRSVPRIALELAKELETEALVSEFQNRPLDAHLEEVRRTRGIDDNGLGHLDLTYLELLERSGPLGEQRLLSMLGSVDRERILTEVEPHLVQRLKFVQMSQKGRELTDLGRRYLANIRKVAH